MARVNFSPGTSLRILGPGRLPDPKIVWLLASEVAKTQRCRDSEDKPAATHEAAFAGTGVNS
jgi:hypothetical protein